MAIPSRGIGWSTEDNLLWQISKQLEQLTNVTAQSCTNCTTTTSTSSSTTTTTTTLPPYKVYTALLERTGATAPTATILENTLGTITFGYTGPGNYPILSSSLFTLNKTFIQLQKQAAGLSGNTLGTLITSTSSISIIQSTTAGPNDADWVFPVCVEIRVYN
jgi:hypothetical protein